MIAVFLCIHLLFSSRLFRNGKFPRRSSPSRTKKKIWVMTVKRTLRCRVRVCPPQSYLPRCALAFATGWDDLTFFFSRLCGPGESVAHLSLLWLRCLSRIFIFPFISLTLSLYIIPVEFLFRRSTRPREHMALRTLCTLFWTALSGLFCRMEFACEGGFFSFFFLFARNGTPGKGVCVRSLASE